MVNVFSKKNIVAALQGRVGMTNLENKVAEIRLSRVNWQSYLQLVLLLTITFM